MIKKYINILLLLFGMFLFPQYTSGQEKELDELDDLGEVSDAFQENFFEALKQKGIENYELALEALNKTELAAAGNPENEAVVHFEMGKNLAYLKRYRDAEEKYNKVLDFDPNRLEVIEALYDMFYLEKNYQAAIPIVEKLIKFDGDYKEDLANLYTRTKQYDKAITILDELDEYWGESDYRNALRSQIYRTTGNTVGQIENLEEKIDKNPKKEQDYLNLIYLYSEEGNAEKAFETAKTLLENQPNSELVHMALYKFYLDGGDAQNAIASMKTVFASQQIEKTSKYQVLSDFIDFVNSNPQYEADLEQVVALFSAESSGQVYEQLGGYYLSKGQKEEALNFYEKGITKDADNFSLLRNTLLLQIEFKKYEEAAKLSKEALEIFPAQPIIYLFHGVAQNELKNHKLAIESLEAGVDFLLDNPTMERDFYRQLSIGYGQSGDQKKAAMYSQKALDVKDSN